MHAREPEGGAVTPQNAYQNLLARLASLDDIVSAIAAIEALDDHRIQRFVKTWQDQASVALEKAKAENPALTQKHEEDLRRRVEREVRSQFDFLAVILNPNEFDVDEHFLKKGNRDRFYSYISHCFSQEILQDDGITKEACAAANDVAMIQKLIVFCCVCKDLEGKYFDDFHEQYQQNIAPHLDNPALEKPQIEAIMKMAKTPAFPISMQHQQFDNKFAEFMQIITDSLQLKRAIMDCKVAMADAKMLLPAHTKLIDEVLSILHGRVDVIASGQRLHIVSVLDQFCRKSNEAHRQALMKLSDILADQFPGLPKAEVISNNLYTLALTAPKSALQSSGMYANSKKSGESDTFKPKPK